MHWPYSVLSTCWSGRFRCWALAFPRGLRSAVGARYWTCRSVSHFPPAQSAEGLSLILVNDRTKS